MGAVTPTEERPVTAVADSPLPVPDGVWLDAFVRARAVAGDPRLACLAGVAAVDEAGVVVTDRTAYRYLVDAWAALPMADADTIRVRALRRLGAELGAEAASLVAEASGAAPLTRAWARTVVAELAPWAGSPELVDAFVDRLGAGGLARLGGLVSGDEALADEPSAVVHRVAEMAGRDRATGRGSSPDSVAHS